MPTLRRSFVCWSLAACLFAAAPGAHASEDLAAKAARGKEAMAAGRFEEAGALYAEIVRALPSEPGMLLNLGMALSMAGRPREAIPHLQAALKLKPDLLPASLFLGTARMELGQPALAVEPLQKVVAAQPRHLESRQMLADAYLSLDRFEAAVRQFSELTEQAPDGPRAWYGLGRSYEGVARGAFERLQQTAPDSDFILRLVAEAMVVEGKPENAFRLYREALGKKPGLAEVHEALARIYEQRDHPEWAAVEREKARAIPAPDCRSPSLECDFRAARYPSVVAAAQPLRTAEGLYWLSRAASELAREAFGRLDRLAPSPEASLLRAEILRSRRRQLGESIVELKKAAAAWPEDLRIRRELATAYFIANDAEAARPLLEDLLKREPDSAELCLLLGETWLKALSPPRPSRCWRGRSRVTRSCSRPRPRWAGPTWTRARWPRRWRPCRPPSRRTRTAASTTSSRAYRDRPGRPRGPGARAVPGDPEVGGDGGREFARRVPDLAAPLGPAQLKPQRHRDTEVRQGGHDEN